MLPARIFLIGFRGSGKTTIAHLLAEQLDYDWADSDALVQEQAGKTIAQIFADDGELAFRDLEAAVVSHLCTRSNCVIALGGGSVLREKTRQLLAHAGPVIWLEAPADVLYARIAADDVTAAQRPNLTDSGGQQEVDQLLAARGPVYESCATHRIETAGKTPAEVVQCAISLL